jgi:hypothetical protein
MLTAAQIYNNPQIDFKSKLFIVTTVCSFGRYVAWCFRGIWRIRRVQKDDGGRGAASCEEREMLNLRSTCLILQSSWSGDLSYAYER